MYKGIKRAEQQDLTKSEAALMIPIAESTKNYIF
jgi:hypothetical protein